MADSEAIMKAVMQAVTKTAKVAVVVMMELNDEGRGAITCTRQARAGENMRTGGT